MMMVVLVQRLLMFLKLNRTRVKDEEMTEHRLLGWLVVVDDEAKKKKKEETTSSAHLFGRCRHELCFFVLNWN